MDKHKLNFFPEMLVEDYVRLKDDIDKNGYDVNYPIWFYEGQILDGWNREKACKELHIEPVYAEFTGSTMDAIEFVMRSNKRRNLTSSQWATIAVEADEIIEVLKKEAKERQIRKPESVSQLIDEQNINRTDTKVAELFNTNRTYFNEAQRLKDEKPELFEAVKRGDKTITEVKREERIKERKELNKNIVLPKGKYSVIYADPAWPVGSIVMDKWESPIDEKYPTMSIDDIKNLPINELSADDCSLFIWTTHTFLPDCLNIIKEWGFKYFCLITWNKGSGWTQFGFHKMTEFLLYAYKGKMNIDQYGKAIPTLISENKTTHSKKPDSIRELIKSKTPEGRLELFARDKYEGWEAWGNEIV